MGEDWIVESRVRPNLAFRYDPCYSASTVEITDVRAILVGLALLAIGFLLGRKSRQDPDALRVSLDEMRRDGVAMRERVQRAENESARNGRILDGLVQLLPVEFRDRLTGGRNSGDG